MRRVRLTTYLASVSVPCESLKKAIAWAGRPSGALALTATLGSGNRYFTYDFEHANFSLRSLNKDPNSHGIQYGISFGSFGFSHGKRVKVHSLHTNNAMMRRRRSKMNGAWKAA